MKFKNLTNFPITIEGNEILPSGSLARVIFDQSYRDYVCGIPTFNIGFIK